MKKNILLLLSILLPVLLISQSPSKLIEKKEYDKAISYCVDKLENGKGNKEKLYPSLKTAFDEANAVDLKQILQLKSGRSPDMWFDVYQRYYMLQQRYLEVSKVQEQIRQDHVNIQVVDYSKDQEVARQNAVAYLYAHAVKLLQTGEKNDAGMAYDELVQLNSIQQGYKNVDLMMRQAVGGSANMALLEVRNLSKATLPPDFLATIEDFSLTHKERKYLDYVVKAAPGQDYSLTLSVQIKSVNVTPGTVNKKEYTASHKNPESFENAYDDDAKKAEDRKHPDYNKCKVSEVYQVKSAEIKGTLRYIESKSGKVVYMVPITARSVFENKTATAEGDMFACPPEVYELLDKPKKKFPKNAEMIYRAGKEFKMLLRGVIWNEAFIN